MIYSNPRKNWQLFEMWFFSDYCSERMDCYVVFVDVICALSKASNYFLHLSFQLLGVTALCFCCHRNFSLATWSVKHYDQTLCPTKDKQYICRDTI